MVVYTSANEWQTDTRAYTREKRERERTGRNEEREKKQQRNEGAVGEREREREGYPVDGRIRYDTRYLWPAERLGAIQRVEFTFPNRGIVTVRSEYRTLPIVTCVRELDDRAPQKKNNDNEQNKYEFFNLSYDLSYINNWAKTTARIDAPVFLQRYSIKIHNAAETREKKSHKLFPDHFRCIKILDAHQGSCSSHYFSKFLITVNLVAWISIFCHFPSFSCCSTE